MRFSHLPLLVLLGSVGWTFPARAQEDGRKVIERAIKELGPLPQGKAPGASLTRIKGTLALAGPAQFTADLWTQTNGAIKSTFHLDVGGTKLTLTQVLQGEKGWMEEENRVQDLDAATITDMKQSAYHDRVMSLRPLLEDKAFNLTGLGSRKVDGKETTAVRVSSEGRPDIFLYFDPESGLLARSEYRLKKEGLGKEVSTAWAFADYRELDSAIAEERVLKAAKVATDGPGLLAYLRANVLSEADRARVKNLIASLSDEAFETREKASTELVRLGTLAVPQLRVAAKDADAEVAGRARSCLEKIEKEKGPDGSLAAALRLVAIRRPDGAAEVLLDLAPGLPDEMLGREVRSALRAVAIRDGKPDKTVEAALNDRDPGRRAAAAAALGRDGGAFENQPGRRILTPGLKKAMKVVMFQDGMKEVEWEVMEVQYFNKLDDRLFVRPR